MAVARIRQVAQRDAESDFRDGQKTPAAWRMAILRIRGGDHLDPALTALQAVGMERMCAAWGVDFALWDEHGKAWLATYALSYAQRIESLLSDAGPPPGVPR